MTAADLARALGGRKSGEGWMARCPAHDDRNPSLSINDRGGRVLVHCFAGCPQDAVIEELKRLGAAVAVLPEFEGGMEMARQAMRRSGVDAQRAEELIQTVKERYLGENL
jgi:hypothetical protein